MRPINPSNARAWFLPRCIDVGAMNSFGSASTIMSRHSIVVTGGRGFIAGALTARLRADGHRVVTTDRQDSANIRDVLSATSPSIIIHAAAELRDEAAMFESNVVLTRDIMEYCRDVSPACRFMLIGSSSEYGRVSKATAETDVLRPGTIYEATKSAASVLTQVRGGGGRQPPHVLPLRERRLHRAHRPAHDSQGYAATYGFQACIIRPYSVYGPGSAAGFVRFLMSKPAAIKLCPAPAHDFIYIDDFVDGVCAVLTRQTKPFDIVNLGSGKQVTNAQLVDAVQAALQHEFVIESEIPPKANDALTWMCDTTHAFQEYGFKATTTLGQGLRRMVDALAVKKDKLHGSS